MLNPSVLIGTVMGAIFAAGVTALLFMGPEPRQEVYVMDVSNMRVVGQGCGSPRQQGRIYIAAEEDQLPGPSCEVVFELVAQD